MFNKEEKGTFLHWLSHWLAFQATAISLHHWKFKYLFHDFGNPWLFYWNRFVFGMSKRDAYNEMMEWHCKHSHHHLEYGLSPLNIDFKRNNWRLDIPDYEEMVINWECSHITDSDAEMCAFDTNLLAFFEIANIYMYNKLQNTI